MAKRDRVSIKAVAHCRYRVTIFHSTVKEFLSEAHVVQQLEEWAGPAFNPLERICKCFIFTLKSLPPPRIQRYFDAKSSATGAQTVLGEIGYYFRGIELKSQSTPVDLIDEFRELVNIRSQSIRRRDVTLYRKDVEAYHDLIPWALSQGLFLLVLKKLKEEPASVNDSNKQQLLFRTVVQDEVTFEGGLDELDRLMRIIRLILDRGANPNAHLEEEYEPSIWSWFLHYMSSHVEHGYDAQEESIKRKCLFAKTDTLLAYGARPAFVTFWRDQTRGSAMMGHAIIAVDIFRKAFPPHEFAILERRIDEAREAGLHKNLPPLWTPDSDIRESHYIRNSTRHRGFYRSPRD